MRDRALSRSCGPPGCALSASRFPRHRATYADDGADAHGRAQVQTERPDSRLEKCGALAAGRRRARRGYGLAL
jgi:hypothetical protein